MSQELTRNELVELVERIMKDGSLAGGQCDEWVSQFIENVPDPKASDYIFWPDRKMTPEEIVDRALSYKMMRLPGRFEGPSG